MLARFLALSLMLLPLASLAGSHDEVHPRISSFAAGIFCAPEVIGTNPAPETIAGVTNIIGFEPDFVSTARRVPAVRGIGFGVKSRAKFGDILNVEITTTHPPIGPEGVTEQRYTSIISSVGTSLTLYQFDFDYELVPGLWTFTAMEGDEVLFRASFAVVPPRDVPELASVCGYENLLS